MKTIRASELNTYLYCQRAWWFQSSGTEPENKAELIVGESVHERHAGAVRTAGCLRILAAFLLLISLALFAGYLTTLLL